MAKASAWVDVPSSPTHTQRPSSLFVVPSRESAREHSTLTVCCYSGPDRSVKLGADRKRRDFFAALLSLQKEKASADVRASRGPQKESESNGTQIADSVGSDEDHVDR